MHRLYDTSANKIPGKAFSEYETIDNTWRYYQNLCDFIKR